MKYVGRHFPQLLPSVRDGVGLGDESQEQIEAIDRAQEAAAADARGLAIYLEPEAVWTVDPRSPWSRTSITPESIGALAQVAFIGGVTGEASELAARIYAEAKRIKKTRPVILRRMFAQRGQDAAELSAAAEHFDGFLVPPNQSHDMAKSFENTKRRVWNLVDQSLENGWTQAPLIAMESPSPEFSERIPDGLCEYLVVENPPPGARFTPAKIIVRVRQGDIPWWITSGNYLYSLAGSKLWWDDWMINPLTFGVDQE
jgi:hypothetical protein